MALRTRVRDWLARRPDLFAVQDEPEGLRLSEIATGKSLFVHAEQVEDVEAHQNWSTRAEYLLVLFEQRPPLALADAGFVFGLDTRHTGPLPGAPATMSFTDYRRLRRHLLHLVESQDNVEHRREALDVTQVLIASVDGARAVGLPVEAEEAELEQVIRRLEAGT